jgi:DNA topoisomerase-1
VQAIEAVARLLGNTPAICKKCYVHPAIIDSYLNGSWFRAMGQGAKRKNAHAKLRAEELAVMALLHHVG